MFFDTRTDIQVTTKHTLSNAYLKYLRVDFEELWTKAKGLMLSLLYIYIVYVYTSPLRHPYLLKQWGFLSRYWLAYIR